MGQDYSYTQPSSSDEFDNTSLLAEAAMYADEAVRIPISGSPLYTHFSQEFLTIKKRKIILF